MERRRPRQEGVTLPGPASPTGGRKRRSRGSACGNLMCRGMVVVLGAVFLVSLLYWLWVPQEEDGENHLQHEIEAQVYAMRDWLWEQVLSSCTSILPPSLSLLGAVRMADASFDGGLGSWRALKGQPKLRIEPLGKERFWTAGKSEDGLSCSHQLLDLKDGTSFNLESAILSSIVPTKVVEDLPEEQKKRSMLMGLIDNNGVLLNATFDLRRGSSKAKSDCGKVGHFCDPSFGDHVWYEVQFKVSSIRHQMHGKGAHQATGGF